MGAADGSVGREPYEVDRAHVVSPEGATLTVDQILFDVIAEWVAPSGARTFQTSVTGLTPCATIVRP